MKTTLAKHHEISFISQLNERFFGFAKHFPAGTHLSEEPTNLTNIDKVL